MIIRPLVVVAALCVSGAAEAQNVWSAPGSTCTPSAVTTTFNRYKTGIASVRHATGNVDPIGLSCAMDRFNSGTTSWNLKLTYEDSTGTSPTAYVRARLYRMAIGTATPVLLTQVSSNSSASTGVNTVSSPTLTHTMDFEANIYWVQIELQRTSDSEIVIFHAVVLDGTSV